MTPSYDLPQFLEHQHKSAWRTRVNQLKRELGEPIPDWQIKPRTIKRNKQTQAHRSPAAVRVNAQ